MSAERERTAAGGELGGRGALGARRGFARSLGFAVLAALGVSVVLALAAPIARGGLALTLAGLAVAYLAWIAGSRRRALGVVLLATPAAALVLVLAPGLASVAVGQALLVSVGRSGFLYRSAGLRRLALEAALLLGGLVLAGALASHSAFGIALAVWGYFLVQSAFFLAAGAGGREGAPAGDPFERVRERLERLLDEMEGGWA